MMPLRPLPSVPTDHNDNESEKLNPVRGNGSITPTPPKKPLRRNNPFRAALSIITGAAKSDDSPDQTKGG